MHLSDYMTAKKLSDEDVAAAVGCARESVSRYRRKLMRPSWDMAEKIHNFSGGVVTANDWLELQTEAAE